jgi:hypothetical protein
MLSLVKLPLVEGNGRGGRESFRGDSYLCICFEAVILSGI